MTRKKQRQPRRAGKLKMEPPMPISPHSNSISTRDDDDDESGLYPDSLCLSWPEETSISMDQSVSSSVVTSDTRKNVHGMEWTSGETLLIYSGEVNESNQPHGQGLYTNTENGQIVKGTFVNGKLQGTGRCAWRTGAHYQGEFVNNKMHGTGVYTLPNGETYMGNFHNGKHHGHGKWVSASASKKYFGSFRDGQREGEGAWMSEDSMYEGEWRCGQTASREQQEAEVVSALEQACKCDLEHRIKKGKDGQIVEVNLECCTELEILPAEIGNLSKLKVLGLRSCTKLRIIPKEIGRLNDMTLLDLSDCTALVTLPRELGGLINMLHLKMSNCENLKSLPPELGKLSELTLLCLVGCVGLSGLPRELSNLNKLQDLNVGGCANINKIHYDIQELCLRNQISIPRRLYDEARTTPPSSTRRILGDDSWTWSGPGGMRKEEKRKKDSRIVRHVEDVESYPEAAANDVDADGEMTTTCRRRAMFGLDEMDNLPCVKEHALRWQGMMESIQDAYCLNDHKQVEERATELLKDTSLCLASIGLNSIGYFPHTTMLAFYSRCLARFKSQGQNLKGAIRDATECLKMIHIEKQLPRRKQRHERRPDFEIVMLRTRGLCLKRSGKMEKAVEDLRACCAAIRLLGSQWDSEPCLKDAVKDVLHTMALARLRENKERPHYTIEQRIGIEKELGIGPYEEAKYMCHECGAQPSDTTLSLCSGCEACWFCSEKCSSVAWRSRHRYSCKKLRQQRMSFTIPSSERQCLQQQMDQQGCVTKVIDGDFVCLMEDHRSGQYFDSLSDKDVLLKSLEAPAAADHRDSSVNNMYTMAKRFSECSQDAVAGL